MDDLTRLHLMAQLKRDEGVRPKMYLDSVDVPTIGVGHNLRDRAISLRACDVILEDDLADTEADLGRALPWMFALSSARQGVLYNMAYNLGVPGLLEFRRTLLAVQSGDYEGAATAMLDSKWAQQVGPRAERLATQMREGVWA